MMPADFSDTRWAADIHITPDDGICMPVTAPPARLPLSVSEDGSVPSVEGFQPTEAQPRGFNIDNSENT